ncbi:MAG: dihydroorotase [Pseudomonadota bacterium]
MTRIEIPRPDDWHLHLRDGAVMRAVLPDTSRHFGRALVMPNLDPPVVTGKDAAHYRDRILAALPDGADFTPLMTLYLTEETDPDDVVAAHADGVIAAVKLYPAGATTNSARGVRDINNVGHTLEAMAKSGVPLCIHGEVADAHTDIFDREKVFIDRILRPLKDRLPELRVTLEHVTTAEGVAFVEDAPGPIAGTITAHHLMLTRNDLLAGGIRPHYYCLPILKRERDRRALLAVATDASSRFFLGTDSAPHLDGGKLAPCGCAGCYTAPVALPYLAQLFETCGKLDALAAFVSTKGAAHYGLPVNPTNVTLMRDQPVTFAASLATEDGPITIFDPGFTTDWAVE